MIVCKVCGFTNEAGARFCGSCGSFLEWSGEAGDDATQASPTQPSTPAPAPTPSPSPTPTPPVPTDDTQPIAVPAPPPTTNEIVCRSCGLVNERDRVFCRRCGAELVPSQPVAGPVGPSRPRTRPDVPLGPLLVVGALAVVLVGGLLLFGGILGEPSATASPTSPTVASAEPSDEPSPSPSPSEESPSPSISGPPQPTGIIAFGSVAGGDVDILTSAPDGTAIEELIGGDGDQVQPAWSRDGSRIAYAAPAGIRIADADGSNGLQFTNHGTQDRKPEWSPDDSAIVFASSRDEGDFEVYLRPIGSDDLVPLTDGPDDDYDPSWSAATDRIAFVSGPRRGDTDVWTMSSDGGALEQLTGAEGREEDPAFSPDGTQLAFASTREGDSFAIYIMNADGTDVRRLTSSTANEHDPAWSPDGNFIAFARGGDGGGIVVVRVEDGEELATILASGAEGAAFPAWR